MIKKSIGIGTFASDEDRFASIIKKYFFHSTEGMMKSMTDEELFFMHYQTTKYKHFSTSEIINNRFAEMLNEEMKRRKITDKYTELYEH